MRHFPLTAAVRSCPLRADRTCTALDSRRKLPSRFTFFSNALLKLLKADRRGAPFANFYPCCQISETHSILAIASSCNCSCEGRYGRVPRAGYVEYAARCCGNIDPAQAVAYTFEKRHAFTT